MINKKVPTIWGVVILISIAVIIGVLILFESKQVQNQSDCCSDSDIKNSNTQSNWKTYKNEKYGFEMKTTSNWSKYFTKNSIFSSDTDMDAEIVDFCISIPTESGWHEDYFCPFRILVYDEKEWNKEAEPCLMDRESGMCGWVDTVLGRKDGKIFTYGGGQDYPDRYYYLLEESFEILKTFKFAN